MRIGWPIVLTSLALTACGMSPPRTGINAYGAPTDLSCVPDARAASGAGHYARGNAPEIGAVLVLHRHGSMDEGHLAVVTDYPADGFILPDQPCSRATIARLETELASR
ncbi:MAG: hypothetical protein PHT60_01330 [Acidiphilium sp.]|nr:hypothetical protein [Acidiphilium sp.]MDD4934397.1 hypothetical protein [Acidiphilium sp.]